MKKLWAAPVILVLVLVFLVDGGMLLRGVNEDPHENLRKAVVTGYISGDSIRVTMEDGTKCSVKLAGAYAPSSGEDFKLALEFTTSRLPLGTTVYLEKAVKSMEYIKSDYIMGYVWLKKPSKVPDEEEVKKGLYDAVIVCEGYGYSIPPWFNGYYNNYIEGFSKVAKKQGKGLWAQ